MNGSLFLDEVLGNGHSRIESVWGCDPECPLQGPETSKVPKVMVLVFLDFGCLLASTALDLVAPYRAILRYYRCDTPYRAVLYNGV